MQNKNTISLKINTGVTFFTAVYEREYKADIYVQDDKVFLQDVRSVDYVPSGYGQGGSAKHYAEEFLCKGCKLTHVDNKVYMRNFLAMAALELDTSMREETGCGQLNKSRNMLREALEDRLEQAYGTNSAWYETVMDAELEVQNAVKPA